MSWILTHAGKHFDLTDPQPEMVDALDIAHGLANCCRFAGQSNWFYSVAQHSVLVSEIVPHEFALEALLHDAAEAYIGDITKPLKRLLPDYRAIERRVDAAIRAAFDLPDHHSREVGEADLILLATERRDLMIEDDREWDCLAGIQPLAKHIRARNQNHAKAMFLERLITTLQQ